MDDALDLVTNFYQNPQEAWEAAISRGLLPATFAEDPGRNFECAACYQGWVSPPSGDCAVCQNQRVLAYPQDPAVLLYFLRDPARILRAEALVREVPRAISAIKEGPARTLSEYASLTWRLYEPSLPASLGETPKAEALYARQWANSECERAERLFTLEHVRDDGTIYRSHPHRRAWLCEGTVAPLVELTALHLKISLWPPRSDVPEATGQRGVRIQPRAIPQKG